MRAAIVALALAFAAGSATAGPSAAQIQNRIDAAHKTYDGKLARYKAGAVTLDEVYVWSVRWLTAVRETPVKGAKLKAALGEHLARMQDLATAVDAAVKAGAATTSDADAAAYYVAEAIVWEARGK
jgi:hypothetical protein